VEVMDKIVEVKYYPGMLINWEGVVNFKLLKLKIQTRQQ